MDNQHRQIKGYRELNQEEIDLMNRVKSTGTQLSQLIASLRANVNAKYDAAAKIEDQSERQAEFDRLLAANPHMWINTAEMELQVCLMKLTRSVAQPTFF